MKSLATVCLTGVAGLLGFLLALAVRQATHHEAADGGGDEPTEPARGGAAGRPATPFQQETLASEGVDATAMSEAEALRRLRRIFPGWDDHET